jgi:hypothetical protein
LLSFKTGGIELKFKFLNIIIMTALTSIAMGQIPFTKHYIAGEANGAVDAFAIDINGDSFIDILAACYSGIILYVNDGDQDFRHLVIDPNVAQAASVYAIDVDMDGDIDVLSASQNHNTIAWYENIGNLSFVKHIITSTADGAMSVFAIDVDTDGDIDVLSASRRDNKIAWYENDGQQMFTTRTITLAQKRFLLSMLPILMEIRISICCQLPILLPVLMLKSRGMKTMDKITLAFIPLPLVRSGEYPFLLLI